MARSMIVRLKDIQRFELDTQYLDRNLVVLDEGLRRALPHRPDVVQVRLISSVHPPVDVVLHNNHNTLYGRGLKEFFDALLKFADEDGGGKGFYIAKVVDVYRFGGLENTYSILTIDQVSDLLDSARYTVQGQYRYNEIAYVEHSPSRRRRRYPRDEIENVLRNIRWQSGSARRGKGIDRAEIEMARETLRRLATKRRTAVKGEKEEKASTEGPAAAVKKDTGAVRGEPSSEVQPRFSEAPRVESQNPEVEKLASEIIETRLLAPAEEIAISFDEGSAASILERLEQGKFDDLESLRLHRESLILSTSPGFDRLISLDVIRDFVPFGYQIGAAREVLERMRGRAILADEVGLGKTIEAGLIMMEYILRGLVRRVLILCPPPLISQWMDEMKSKFGMDFIASDDPAFLPESWLSEDRIIASIDTAKREPHSKLVKSAPFDLVIVDEAHRCRNKNTLNWKLVNELKKKYILLLTATPVQNDLRELFNLITLLRPGQLETATDFSRRFITKGDRLKPKNTAELRALMREVMVRNRRETCALELPRRHAETVRLSLSPGEEEFYSEVSRFVRREYSQRSKAGPIQLVLKTLQKEAGSSPFAVMPTLLKMNESSGFAHARGELSRLLDMGRSIKASAKAEALYKLLRATDDKVLVFTGYTETLNYLARFLQEAGVPFATFSGEMPRMEKERSIEAFRNEARVLLSTESGGEGRNLQFCHIMVNFDLPWNPMRIEQRIGRIHRIGQKNDVYIFNLSAERTLEARILDILDAKINMFELVVGELDMILGNIEEEADFEDTVMDLWAGATSEEDVSERFARLGEELASAKARYNEIKEYDDRLFGSDLSTEATGVGGHA